MVLFFVVAMVLLLVALALVLQPLVRRFDDRDEQRRDGAVDLGRNRLAELKEKRRTGDISEAEYEEQVRDLEAQVADDLRVSDSFGHRKARSGGRWLGIVVVVFIPLMSGLLYLALGQPRTLIAGGETPRAAASGHPAPADVEEMASRLADRLEQNPDDAEGWFMLGRSYMVLNRYRKAAGAFARMRELVGNEPNVLVSEATALAMANGGDLSGDPVRLLQLALEEKPDHVQALWLAGTAAYQREDHDTALDYYRRVEPMMEGEPLQQVQNMIRELTGSRPERKVRDEPGETRAVAASGASLEVTVSLAGALHDKPAAKDTVFIFARAVDGPPMPLAVVRRTVADLPVTISLNDSHAMMPELKLSGFEQVKIGARISGSGQPTAQPGDLEGESGVVSTDTNQAVEVTIDRVVSGR